MAAFTPLYASGIHLCCWPRTIVHFLCCIVFHYMTVPQFTYPFCSRWTLRLFSMWGYYKECCPEHSHVDLLVTHAHTSVVCGIGVELLGHELYMDGTLFVLSGSVLFIASRKWFMGLSLYAKDGQTCPLQDKWLPVGFEMLMNREICRLRDCQPKVRCRYQICCFPSSVCFSV